MYLKVFCSALVAVWLLDSSSAQQLLAVVYLSGPSPYTNGNITFAQPQGGPVSVRGKIIGLTPGRHGFHVHEKGDLTGGCATAGGHYNPFQKKHGGPLDYERHVGDLGNINAASDGIAIVSAIDNQLALSGPYSIIGRAVVVHSDPDDLGKGGFQDSLTTGHAGARVACGVIGLV